MLKVFEFIEIVAAFHAYVMHENTGDASTFAKKLGVSRATIYRLIDELKSYGIHIKYSHARQTYFYQYPERVQINISIKELYDENLPNLSLN